MQTTKFSLTSFSLISFICFGVRHKLTSTLTRSLVQKLGRLCGALTQGKLVHLYTRAIKTCQGKLLEKTCSSYTRARNLQRNLSRKTWSSVRGLTPPHTSLHACIMIYWEIKYIFEIIQL